MPDEPTAAPANRGLAAKIVAAYVRGNAVGGDQIPALISTVHETLTELGKPAAEVPGARAPAVPIRRSVQRDFVVCLECGWHGKVLRRHVSTHHGLSIDQYRSRWKLPPGHPMVAPAYSERRSGMAKQHGLGRRVGKSAPSEDTAKAGVAASSRRRRRRPRSKSTAPGPA